MNPPYQPGQKCRVIGGRMAYNDEGKGPNIGKEVTTMFLHIKQAGMEKENVWHCRAKDGELLQTYFGVGNEADFLECWLQVVDEQELPNVLVKEKTLEV